MLRNIAIVMLNHTVTKMQPGDGAILAPAISSDAWEAGLTTRVVLFRDWGRDNQNIHFASVTRAVGSGIGSRDGLGRLVAMSLDKVSLVVLNSMLKLCTNNVLRTDSEESNWLMLCLVQQM